ncbi:DUF3291 domain-containing protein [Streptosporangiaceae bacterium NEAU-GS5]|nr:DUF3291 domain-containing protein [Streptosporangiaceae bacterium NEAU-GS5]
MHLAELNVARLLAPLDAPQLASFVAALDPVNAMAEAAPGFLWRLKDEVAPTVRHDYGDDLLINCSVWESREALWNFTYRTSHLAFLQRRREWFSRMAEPFMVMWWVPPGSFPTAAQAMARLERLRAEGPGPEAFTFRSFYELPAEAEVSG